MPNLPAVIGPFSYFDVRATATQRVFDWKSIQKYRAAVATENASHSTLKDARELVVLAAGNIYLQALADGARVETAQAQQDTAKALYEKALAQQQAGVAPAIDTLRAQVEYQARRQQLISVTNDFAKQKLILARIIGLAPARNSLLPISLPTSRFPSPILKAACGAHILCAPTTRPLRNAYVAARLARNAAAAGDSPPSMLKAITARLAPHPAVSFPLITSPVL